MANVWSRRWFLPFLVPLTPLAYPAGFAYGLWQHRWGLWVSYRSQALVLYHTILLAMGYALVGMLCLALGLLLRVGVSEWQRRWGLWEAPHPPQFVEDSLGTMTRTFIPPDAYRHCGNPWGDGNIQDIEERNCCVFTSTRR
jgi:hypothetical protein